LLNSKEIRQSFIDFFKERKHTFVPSVPVVPLNDPTLLFINAGMNQFKDIFLGMKSPSFSRAVNSQKCIRVSGKHNDLEEVGPSNRHHTFFEMLGNWSFGDYYKKEAINWAWELITKVWGLPKDKLYATVYTDDDEAENFWKNETDINHSHISRHGKKDNFWEMGEIGPCGPCSEIHMDLGPEACDKKGIDHVCQVNGECGRIVELWNLVFIQYNRGKDGTLNELPAKHVDTGAGLERLSAVLQNGISNYDSDLFQPLINVIADISGVPYGETVIPHRVIADHIRTLDFAIADGALPSNEGRGYVLRRILRRAARYGHEIGLSKPFLYKLTPVIVDLMGDVYPELKEKHQHISLVTKSEEEGFTSTLSRGLDIFAGITDKLTRKNQSEIPGDEAFRLYDTYGFPYDLTELMAREKGFTVDSEGFTSAMDEQRRRARSSGKFVAEENNITDWILTDKKYSLPPDEWQKFVGYSSTEHNSIVAKYRSVSDYFELIPVETPFYSEAGGQVGDTGEIITLRGNSFKVLDSYFDESGHRTLKVEGDVSIFENDIKKDEIIVQKVDVERRRMIIRNHTATHLLQLSLRIYMGDHVHQAGSLVHPDYMRFDYTHFEKPDNETLMKVEAFVNRKIMENYKVSASMTTIDAAREKGAMALFGEKYGEEVRMISIDEISHELCGGTHVNHTGDIGHFRITSETGVSAGIRRIEAVTGYKALDEVVHDRKTIEKFRELLHSHGSDTAEKLEKFIIEKKELDKEVEKLRKTGGGINIQDLLKNAVEKNDSKVLAKRVKVPNMDALKDLGDAVREKVGSGIGFLGAEIDGKATLVCVVTDDLISKGIKAGDLVKRAAEAMGGGGGGRPHLATAGAKNAEKLDEALKLGIQIAEEKII